MTKNRQEYEQSFKSTHVFVFTVRNGPREEDMCAIYDLIQYPTDNDDVTIARLLVTSHGRYVTRDQTVEMSRLIMVLLYITLRVTLPPRDTTHAGLFPFEYFIIQSIRSPRNVISTNDEHIRLLIPVVTAICFTFGLRIRISIFVAIKAGLTKMRRFESSRRDTQNTRK